MPVKTIDQVPEEEKAPEKKKLRGTDITLEGKKYFIRKPKAKDLAIIEEKTQDINSTFTQGLMMVDILCDELSLDYLMELYAEDLGPVFDVFDKLMPANAFPTPKNQ